MGQIVSASKTPRGTYLIEVKALNKERISESGNTVQVAGVVGWAERVDGLFDTDGKPLTVMVQIRKKNI